MVGATFEVIYWQELYKWPNVDHCRAATQKLYYDLYSKSTAEKYSKKSTAKKENKCTANVQQKNYSKKLQQMYSKKTTAIVQQMYSRKVNL